MISKKRGIKAVVFDVGGVLALGKNQEIIKRKGNRTFGVHQYIARKLNVSLDQWLDSIDSVYADAIEGKISKEKTLKTISGRGGNNRKTYIQSKMGGHHHHHR